MAKILTKGNYGNGKNRQNRTKQTAITGHYITVHSQAILLLVVESGTRKFRCLSVECLFVEPGTYDVICQFCTVKGLVVESEVLKAQIAL